MGIQQILVYLVHVSKRGIQWGLCLKAAVTWVGHSLASCVLPPSHFNPFAEEIFLISL